MQHTHEHIAGLPQHKRGAYADEHNNTHKTVKNIFIFYKAEKDNTILVTFAYIVDMIYELVIYCSFVTICSMQRSEGTLCTVTCVKPIASTSAFTMQQSFPMYLGNAAEALLIPDIFVPATPCDHVTASQPCHLIAHGLSHFCSLQRPDKT